MSLTSLTSIIIIRVWSIDSDGCWMDGRGGEG